MAMFNSYVSLPEGMSCCFFNLLLYACVASLHLIFVHRTGSLVQVLISNPAKDFFCSAQIRPSLAQETRKLQLQSQPGSPCHPVKNTHAHGYTICK